MIDILLLQSFHITNNISFKLLFAMLGFYDIILTSIVSYFANSLSHPGYSRYGRLNSIVALGQSRKKEGRWLEGISFNLKSQLKLVGLLERLSGSENGHHKIAVYCLDLFPIVNFEYYLFICNIIANYMMIMELIH